MAQSDKRENSVLFSLRELRQIEENRVQEEEHAVRSAEETRRMAKEAEERRKREEEEAKLRAERDHLRSIEEAKANAEREARMRVESAEAAERARQQAALDQQRLQQEMELRRAEVAQKRPTWMLAVTAAAVIGIVIAGIVGVRAYQQSQEDSQKRIQAEAEKEEYGKQVKAAQAQVAQAQKDLDENASKVDKAIADVGAAQDAVALKAAQQRLQELQREQAEIRGRVEAAKQAAAKAERARGVHVSQECLNNPLAKGCN
jgi:DNA repair exonuclease SbcCD ATPase subunit